MGKRKKKKVFRPVCQGAQPSLNDELGISVEKDPTSNLKEKEDKQVQDEQTGTQQQQQQQQQQKEKEGSHDDTIDVVDGNENDFDRDKSEGLSCIPADLRPVFLHAQRRRATGSSGSQLISGDDPLLELSHTLEKDAIKLLSKRGMLDDYSCLGAAGERTERQQSLIQDSWKETLSRMDRKRVRQRLLQVLLDLESLGLALDKVKLGLERCGPDFEATLEWLVLHLADCDLPPGWARTAQGTEKLSVIQNKASSSKIAVNPPKRIDVNSKAKQDKVVKRKNTGVLSDQERLLQKEQTLRALEMQEQHRIAEELRLAEEARRRDEFKKLPPLEQCQLLEKEITELRQVASEGSGADRKKAQNQIRNLSVRVKSIKQKNPEVYAALAALEKEAASQEKAEEEEQAANIEEQEAELDGDHGADLFGAMFDDEGADDSGPLANNDRGKPIDLGELKSNSKRDPCFHLLETVKKKFGKSTNIKYRRLEDVDLPTNLHSWSVSFKGHYIEMGQGEFCTTMKMAQNYIALKALYNIAGDRGMHLVLPRKCADLWTSWKETDARAAEEAEIAEKMDRVSVVEEISAKYAGSTVSDVYAVEENATTTSSSGKPNSERNGNKSHRPRNENKCEGLQAKLEVRRRSEAYQKFEQSRKQLPVVGIQEELEALISGNDVVVVSGSTGSGKTTQIPRMLFEFETMNGRGSNCSIICTEPRRISAVTVAERVSDEVGDPNGIGQKESYVGYQVRGEKRASADCRVMYCTTGILLRHLQLDPELLAYSHVVVDEVHERTVDSDFLLVTLRRLVRKGPRSQGVAPLKVVLMSATIDLNKLAEYFDGAPIIEAGGRSFPVSRFMLEDCVELTRYSCELDSDFCRRELRHGQNRKTQEAMVGGKRVTYQGSDDIDREDYTGLNSGDYRNATIETVYRVDEARVNYDLIEMLLLFLVSGEMRGTAQANCIGSTRERFLNALDALQMEANGDSNANAILIFLPGMGQIQALFDRFSHHRVLGDTRKFQVLRLHSSLSALKDEQKAVFRDPPPGIIKIVLATNIAETGVTIPDVVYVIDSGRLKQTGYKPGQQIKCLEETFVSRASLTQRAGRAGRVRPGIAFHLVSSKLDEVEMKDFQTPEICRVPLEGVCLQILSIDKSQRPWDFLNAALDPPNEKSVDIAMTNLQEAGAVRVWNQEAPDGDMNESFKNKDALWVDVTPLGKHLTSFPLDFKVGKMLLFGCIFKCLDPVLTVAASIGLEQKVYLQPSGRQAEAAQAHRAFQHDLSDLLSLHKLYRAWRQDIARNSQNDWKFCKANFVSRTSLVEIRDIKRDLLALLQQSGFADTSSPLDPFTSSDGKINDKYPRTDELNKHSHNDALLCAIIAAGLYPNLAKVTATRPSKADIVYTCKSGSGQDETVQLTKSSTIAGRVSPLTKSIRSGLANSTWITFVTKMKVSRIVLYDGTFVPHMAIALFGGNLGLSVKGSASGLVIDRHLRLRVGVRTAAVVARLRAALDKHLEMRFDDTRNDDGQLVDLLVRLFAFPAPPAE